MGNSPSSGTFSWKDAAGRSSGDSGYRFGDITRSLLRKRFSKPKAQRHQPPLPVGPVTANTVWRNFMNISVRCGRSAVTSGTLSVEDVEDQEPFLFLGLPALTVFEALMRSLQAPANCIVLSSGHQVTPANVPEESGGRSMLEAMILTKAQIIKTVLSSSEVDALRRKILESDTADSSVDWGSQERRAELMAIVASVHSIATGITQQPFYQDNFALALEQIAKQPEQSSSQSSSSSPQRSAPDPAPPSQPSQSPQVSPPPQEPPNASIVIQAPHSATQNTGLTCPACTFINKSGHLACAMCGTQLRYRQ